MSRSLLVILASAICCALLVVVQPPLASAGGLTRARGSCKVFAKYVARSEIEEDLINTNNGQIQTYVQCDHRDTGCGYASATCTWLTQCGQATINAFRNASTNTITWPQPIPANCALVRGGGAFVRPALSPNSRLVNPIGGVPDTVGSASSSITTTSGVDSLTGSVHINAITAELSATTTSQYGAVYRAIVWRSEFDGDTSLTKGKVLWDSSVRVERGHVVTTGAFAPADFIVDTLAWADGTSHVRVRSVAGLSKSIPLAFNNTDNHVELVEYMDQGFGLYNPDYVFVDTPNSPAFSVPLLNPAALLGLLGALLLSGRAALRSRRRLQ